MQPVKQTQKDEGHHPHFALIASYCALGSVTVLIILKTYAYYLSGATTLLATLTDSIVDMAVSLMLLFALRLSLKPADNDHRHGHGKVEGIATLLQGAFMGGAGIFLAFEAFKRILNPVDLSHHGLGIAVTIVTIILSVGVLIVQKYALRRAPSLIISADHAHYKTDIFLNTSVMVALFIDYYGGAAWLDPVFGFIIAGYFIYTAYTVTQKSVDMLMDKELPNDIRNHIETIIEQDKRVHGMHDLRTRLSGMNIHISFDVELDPTLSLKAAHDIVRELDHLILAHYPNAEIIIHMDPIGDTDDPRHAVEGVHH